MSFKYERHAGGYILIDGQEVAHTLQCVHCGTHFVSIKGSGTTRGWCHGCHGVTCGAEACFEHIPVEAKIEFAEGTKNPYTDKITELYKQFGKTI